VHLVTKLFCEIDQDVPAQDRIELIERRVCHEIVACEYDLIAQAVIHLCLIAISLKVVPQLSLASRLEIILLPRFHVSRWRSPVECDLERSRVHIRSVKDGPR